MSLSGQNTPIGQASSVRVKFPGVRRSVSRSATRALDVLEYFGEERRPLRANEIARALDLRTSTADQLLKTMVESAHLFFDARSKTYVPSHRLGHFSAWVLGAYGGTEGLQDLLMEVQSATEEIVTLTTPNDLFMQIADFACGWPGGGRVERGLRVSMFGSVTGSAYLSSLSDSEIARLASRARLPLAEHAAVLESVVRIREEGLAEGPSQDGAAWSLAVPLPVCGMAPMVFGIGGPADRVRANSPALRALLKTSIARWAAGQTTHG